MEADAHITARVAELEACLQELSDANDKLQAEREQYRELYLQMLELNKKLERGILGQKAEKLPPDEAQLTLQLLASLLGRDPGEQPAQEAPRQEVRSHQRRKPTGRKPLPEDLPRVEIELLPDEVKREGLDAFCRIGEEVRETVERRPSSMVAVRVIRPKFVRKGRGAAFGTRVAIADPIELPIPRGVAGPGLLADSLVRRFQDHLPLNRLEGVQGRHLFRAKRTASFPSTGAGRRHSHECKRPYAMAQAARILATATHQPMVPRLIPF